MSNPLVPAQQTGGAPPVNTQEIGFLVRNWVHYDNLALENAMIQIAGGRLMVQEERHNQPLTLSRIEEILHLYFTNKNMPDDTANIMKFMKKQRGFEVHKKLRKQSGTGAPPLPPPPAPPAQG
jgi:hypothetical protein